MRATVASPGIGAAVTALERTKRKARDNGEMIRRRMMNGDVAPDKKIKRTENKDKGLFKVGARRSRKVVR